MAITKSAHAIESLEEKRRKLEANLSQEQCKILQQIRALRKSIGPINQNVGAILWELDEAGIADAS